MNRFLEAICELQKLTKWSYVPLFLRAKNDSFVQHAEFKDEPLTQKKSIAELGTFLCLACLGCGLITLSSLVKIPFFPVPFTLQTFAVFVLALTQSPKQACASVLCYLLCGTLGLPVFCAKSKTLWFLGKCAGYLVAFPIAAYVTGKLTQNQQPWMGLLIGQLIIYFVGFVGLVPFVGAKMAFLNGVLLFLPSDILKNLGAMWLAHYWNKWRASCIL